MADATQVQRRRGTEAQCDGMTPAEAEVIVDLTNDTLRVGDGVRAGGFIMPNFSHIQRQSFGYAVSAGTGNAITVDLSPALLAYADGVALEFKASNNNTGAATINVNGLGAKSIKKLSGGVLTDVASGDLVAGIVYRVTYDGTQFQVTNAEFTPPAPTGGLVKISTTTLNTTTVNIAIPGGYTSYRLDILDFLGGNLSIDSNSYFAPSIYPEANCLYLELIAGADRWGISGQNAAANANFSFSGGGSKTNIALTSGTMISGTATLYGRQ